MIAPFAKFIDWSIIQMASIAMRPPPTTRLEEAVQFLNGPDFIPAESLPVGFEVAHNAGIS